jgi:hypothetical protein
LGSPSAEQRRSNAQQCAACDSPLVIKGGHGKPSMMLWKTHDFPIGTSNFPMGMFQPYVITKGWVFFGVKFLQMVATHG